MGDRMTALDAAFYHLERTGPAAARRRRLHGRRAARLRAHARRPVGAAAPDPALHAARRAGAVEPRPSDLGAGARLRPPAPRRPARAARAGRRRAARAAWPAGCSPSRSTARARSGSCTRSTATAAIAARILAKVHHCMIDGVSGVQLLGVMFDVTPNPPPPPAGAAGRGAAAAARRRRMQARARAAPTAPPTARRGRARAARAAAPSRRARGASSRRRSSAFGRDACGCSSRRSRRRRSTASSARCVASSGPTLPLNEVKAVKNRLGGTVNDVILATITGALRRYLEDRGLNPDRIELRAMCPVNLRTKDEHLKLGNRVSAMMAPLPVGIFDPLERLRQVRTAMEKVKRSRRVGADEPRHGSVRVPARAAAAPDGLAPEHRAGEHHLHERPRAAGIALLPGARGSRRWCRSCHSRRAWGWRSRSSATPTRSPSAPISTPA